MLLAESPENIEDLRILEQKRMMEVEIFSDIDEMIESENSETSKKRSRAAVMGALNPIDDVDDVQAMMQNM
jgi:hypothetical protein